MKQLLHLAPNFHRSAAGSKPVARSLSDISYTFLMRKQIFVLLFIAHCLLFITNCYSQQPTQEWVRVYNGPTGGSDAIRGMTVDKFGNVYVTGAIVQNNVDIATIKYNSAGAQQWVSIFTGPPNSMDDAVGVVVDTLGNVYVSGYSGPTFGPYDFVTIKYNINGVQQWAKIYDSGGDDTPGSIAIDRNGFVYVTGGSNGAIATIKYNSLGDSLWVKRYIDPGRVSYGQKIVTNDTNIYIAGSSNLSSPYDVDFLTLKYNVNGQFSWAVRYAGPLQYGSDGPYDIAVDNFGNVVVTGVAANGPPRYDDYATIKYNWNGVEQWVRLYNAPGSYYDNARAVATDMTGDIYVTGVAYWGTSFGGYNSTTIKYSLSGDSLWVRHYISSNGSGTNSITLDDSGNAYVTGNDQTDGCITIKYDNNGNQDWLATYTNSTGKFIKVDNSKNVYIAGSTVVFDADFLTIKYSQPVGIHPQISSVPVDFALDQNYPNPFNSSSVVTYALSSRAFVNISIYDINGRFVDLLTSKEQNAGNYSVIWNANRFSSGIYFCKLEIDYTKFITKTMILTK